MSGNQLSKLMMVSSLFHVISLVIINLFNQSTPTLCHKSHDARHVTNKQLARAAVTEFQECQIDKREVRGVVRSGQLPTLLTVITVYCSILNKHIKLQKYYTLQISGFICENEAKMSLVPRVSEKNYLVIAEFKLFHARYRDGKFT